MATPAAKIPTAIIQGGGKDGFPPCSFYKSSPFVPSSRMGIEADYGLTDNGDGTHDLDYLGNMVTLTGIEEIQFTDNTLYL